MVCPFGTKRMATMSRLLAAKNFSQTIAEEVGRQKVAAQYIQREFCEADEANLLDEEDMHVFDLKPMTDPLYLVCCNSCKKPVKISQYAAHAEICRSLSSTQEVMSELDNNGCRKPPKKERKKTTSSLATNHTASSLEQLRFGSAVTDNVALSEHVHGNTFGMNNAYVMDSSGNRDYSTGSMLPPSTKRSRLAASNVSPISDHLATATATGVYRSAFASARDQDDIACRELAKGSSGGIEGTNALVPYQNINQERDCYLPSKGVPAPLATKVFYSQRNSRLRLSMDHLYYESSANEHISETVNQTARPGNSMMMSQTSSLKNSANQINEHDQEQVGKCSLACMQTTPDHNASLAKGGHKPGMNSSVNNMSKHDVEPNGPMISNRYTPNHPYSLAGKSEAQQVGKAQQSKRGRLPVI